MNREENFEIACAQLDSIMGSRVIELNTEKTGLLLDIIREEEEENRIPLLAYVLGIYGAVKENDALFVGKRRMPEKRFKELQKSLSERVHHTFHVWISNNPSNEDLAGKIWNLIHTFKKEDEQDFILTDILRDAHIPYCKIPEDIQAPTEEEIYLYEHRLDKDFNDLENERILIRNIVNRVEMQYAAGLLWRYLNRIENGAQRCALTLYTMNMIYEYTRKEGGLSLPESLLEGLLKNFSRPEESES